MKNYEYINRQKYNQISKLPEEYRAKEAFKAIKRLRVKRRVPELEQLIINQPEYASFYAKDILKNRWTEAEPTILNGKIKTIYNYCLNVVKGRWKEAEDKILQDPEFAFLYSKNIIKGRWKEAENAIIALEKSKINDLWGGNCYMFQYCEEIIKDRWPDIEDVISENASISKDYADFLKTKLPEKMHNIMLCKCIGGNEEDKETAEQYLENLKGWNTTLIRQLKMFDPDKTVSELLKELQG